MVKHHRKMEFIDFWNPSNISLISSVLSNSNAVSRRITNVLAISFIVLNLYFFSNSKSIWIIPACSVHSNWLHSSKLAFAHIHWNKINIRSLNFYWYFLPCIEILTSFRKLWSVTKAWAFTLSTDWLKAKITWSTE